MIYTWVDIDGSRSWLTPSSQIKTNRGEEVLCSVKRVRIGRPASTSAVLEAFGMNYIIIIIEVIIIVDREIIRIENIRAMAMNSFPQAAFRAF